MGGRDGTSLGFAVRNEMPGFNKVSNYVSRSGFEPGFSLGFPLGSTDSERPATVSFVIRASWDLQNP